MTGRGERREEMGRGWEGGGEREGMTGGGERREE